MAGSILDDARPVTQSTFEELTDRSNGRARFGTLPCFIIRPPRESAEQGNDLAEELSSDEASTPGSFEVPSLRSFEDEQSRQEGVWLDTRNADNFFYDIQRQGCRPFIDWKKPKRVPRQSPRRELIAWKRQFRFDPVLDALFDHIVKLARTAGPNVKREPKKSPQSEKDPGPEKSSDLRNRSKTIRDSNTIIRYPAIPPCQQTELFDPEFRYSAPEPEDYGLPADRKKVVVTGRTVQTYASRSSDEDLSLYWKNGGAFRIPNTAVSDANYSDNLSNGATKASSNLSGEIDDDDDDDDASHQLAEETVAQSHQENNQTEKGTDEDHIDPSPSERQSDHPSSGEQRCSDGDSDTALNNKPRIAQFYTDRNRDTVLKNDPRVTRPLQGDKPRWYYRAVRNVRNNISKIFTRRKPTKRKRRGIRRLFS